MDLHTIERWRRPTSRAQLALGPGEAYVAGGTFLFSEPQRHLTGLVELAALDWPDWEPLPGGGLRISATCSIAALQRLPWPLSDLTRQAADALLMSWKVQSAATVGGNLCLALPAGAMTSLFAGLGATAWLWTPGGGERRLPVAAFVTGVGTSALLPGELLRGIEVPASALGAAYAFRRVSLTSDGRSAAVVVGRRDAGRLVLTVTASTPSPVVLALAETSPEQVRDAVRGIDAWHDDVHGAPDWRAAMTERLAVEVAEELA